DPAEADAVDDVADRPAHDQADGGDQQTSIRPRRPPGQHAGHHDGEDAQDPAARAAAEQAEADARVQHIGQIEHRRGDLGDAIAVGNERDMGGGDGSQHPGLGQLVQDDDGQGDAVGAQRETGNLHGKPVSRKRSGGEEGKTQALTGARRPFPPVFPRYKRGMTLPHPLPRLSAVADDYDILLCDVWGVIHNGRESWPAACEALTKFNEKGGHVVLISNSPRPSPDVVAQLDALGVPRSAWKAFVTSGDATRMELARRAPGPAWIIGPDRDFVLYEGLDLTSAHD